VAHSAFDEFAKAVVVFGAPATCRKSNVGGGFRAISNGDRQREYDF
jgi:hypothetical protein